MNDDLRALFQDLGSTDDKIRLNALQAVLGITEQRVDWIYEVWEDMLAKLAHPNSYQRSIGIMVLCNLAKSDHENRMAAGLESLLSHTQDEKFITSRQCIQNIWKVAAADMRNRDKVIEHLEKRFRECVTEKHYNLLRLDIIQSIKNVYEDTGSAELLEKARKLIAEESDAGNQKKYDKVLKANTRV